MSQLSKQGINLKIREFGKKSTSHNGDADRHMLIFNGVMLQGFVRQPPIRDPWSITSVSREKIPFERRTSTGSKVFFIVKCLDVKKTCLAKCLYSSTDDLPENLGKTTA